MFTPIMCLRFPNIRDHMILFSNNFQFIVILRIRETYCQDRDCIKIDKPLLYSTMINKPLLYSTMINKPLLYSAMINKPLLYSTMINKSF